MSRLIYFFSIRTFGPPTRVQSDRETEFKGAVKNFLKECGIQNIESQPYHPQSQGKIKRFFSSAPCTKPSISKSSREMECLSKLFQILAKCISKTFPK